MATIIKITKTYLDFNGINDWFAVLGTGKDLIAGAQITGVDIRIRSAFSGTGISNIQIGLGNVDNPEEYYYADATAESNSGVQISIVKSFDTPTEFKVALFVDSDKLLTALTAGSADIYITISGLEQLTIPAVGNTSFMVYQNCFLNAICMIGTPDDVFNISRVSSGDTDMGTVTIGANGTVVSGVSDIMSVDAEIYIQTTSTNAYQIKAIIL